MPDDFDEIERRFGKAPAAPVADDFDAIEARFAAPNVNVAKAAIDADTPMDFETKREILRRVTKATVSPSGTDLFSDDVANPRYRHQIDVDFAKVIPGATSKAHGDALLREIPTEDFTSKPPVRSGNDSPMFKPPPKSSFVDVATTLAKRAAHGVTSPPAFLGDLLLGKEGAEQLRSEHTFAPGSGVGLSPEREAVARAAIERSGIGRAANMAIDLGTAIPAFKALGRGLTAAGAGPMLTSSGTMAVHGGLTGGGEGFGSGAIFGALAHGIEMPLSKWIDRLPAALKGTVVERLSNAGAGGTSFAAADAVMNGVDAERAIAQFGFGGLLGWTKAVARVEATPETPLPVVAAIGHARLTEAEYAKAAAREAAVRPEAEPTPGEPIDVTIERGQNRLSAQAAPEAPAGFSADMFHGSPVTDLRSVRANPESRQYDNAASQLGAFFAPSEAEASRYSGKGGRIYPARVNLQRPYEMPWSEFNKFQSPDKGPDGKTIADFSESGLARRTQELKSEASSLRKQLEAEGYDGIVVKSARGKLLEVASFKDVALPEAPAAPREEVIQPKAEAPKPSSKEYLASIRAADKARESAPRPEMETITPANDRLVGENSDGVPVYERADGFRYRVRDGRVMTGGDLSTREPAPTEAPKVEAMPSKPGDRLVKHPLRGEIEVRGSGPATYWRDPTDTTSPFAGRFVLASPEFRAEIEAASPSHAPSEPGFVLVGKTNKGQSVYRRPNYREGDPLMIRGESGRLGAANPRDVAEAKANALAEAARKPAVPVPPEPLPTVGEQIARHAEAFVNPGGKSVSPEAGFVHPEILAAAGGKIREASGRVAGALKDAWTGLANKTFPRMTKENPEASAALASKVSTRVTAELFKRRVSQEVLGTDLDPVEFGGALVEANLRDIRRKMVADGDTESAAKVVSILGAEGSPFKTEAEWRSYLTRPDVKAAIERHNKMWERDVDPLYKTAQDIEEGANLPTRGSEAGNARVNLLRVDPKGEAADGNGAPFKPSGPIIGGQGNTGNLFVRKSPFGRKATGAAEGGYALDYREMMGNTYNQQATNAYLKQGLNNLVKNNDAEWVARGAKAPEAIKGERPVLFDVKGPSGQRIAVRAKFASELRSAMGLDSIPKFTPIVDRFVKGVNTLQLVGITDNVIHSANTLAILLTRPMSGINPKLDAALSAAGRADLLVTVPKFVRNFFAAGERVGALEELANNSALSRGVINEPLRGLDWLNPHKLLQHAGTRIDVAARLTAYDSWKAMAKRGEVVNTPESLREFVNQFGQYTTLATDPISRWLKQTGLTPFLVAGKRGLTTAVKTPTLSPGVKATANGTAVALRTAMLAKIAGTVGAIGLANYKKTGSFDGGPGVPMFALVTGEEKDENGKKTGVKTYVDPLSWLGLRKAFNLYGGKYAETKRMGLSDADARQAQIENVISALGFYARGPAVDVGIKTLTGHGAGFHMPEYDKVVGRSQTAENFKSAMLDAPKSLMNTTAGIAGALGIEAPNEFLNQVTGQNKTSGERGSEALAYFGERKSRTTAQQESLPDRARYRQIEDFQEDVYTKIVRLPMDKREQYLASRLADNDLTPDEKRKIRNRVARYLPPAIGGK